MRKAVQIVISTSLIISLAMANVPGVFAANATGQTKASSAAGTQQKEQEKMVTVGTVKTQSTSLNVRQEPNTSAKIIGKLPNKATVIIEKTQDNWHYITYGSLKGWTSGDYIADIKKVQASAISRSDSREAYEIIEYAKTLIGCPYKSGGSSPKGFDCSGYVSYVFGHFGISVPRSSKDYPAFGEQVPRSELLPGDIICSDTTGKIDGTISHVAIYIGNGNFIHAASGGKRQITINSLSEEYYDKRFVCAVRVLD